jgi:addiction module RelE/StbE family toxin
MAQVIWTEQAIEDIDNIAEYISKNSLKYAQIQVYKFFDLASILELQPKAGRKVPETSDESIRELITGTYRLIYKIRHDNDILILTVHHSSRLLSNNPKI